MNKIKGLIIKDLRNIKSYKSTILFFIVIFAITGFFNDTAVSFIPVSITMCFGMMAMASFSYDNLANSDRYILTFPLTRKDMVKARYLYTILMTIAGAVVGNILAIGFQFVKVGNFDEILNCLLSSLGSVFGIMILQMFQMPIMYKFGAEKGRLIQMIAIILVMLGISSVTAFLIKISPFSLEDFGNMLKQYGLAVIGMIVVILYFASYKISVGIFEKREI